MRNCSEDWAVVKGVGDLGTGVAYSLLKAGFRVLATEISRPLVVRRTVSFAQAIYSGWVNVQDVKAQMVENIEEAWALAQQGIVPVLVDPQAHVISQLKPVLVVDAIMAKRNTGTAQSDAPVVIGLGPGLMAGKDVHAVIETCRGPNLGQIIYRGRAQADSKVPGAIDGHTWERLLRAPATGIVSARVEIGNLVSKGQILALVEDVPVKSNLDGVLRGMIQPGLYVKEGTKIGDVDSRRDRSLCYKISDKALKVGEGTVRAALKLRGKINPSNQEGV
ncbi:MAG: EF2563 family selenium-dependent molybdenum hydroxylase system protein [Firmicutes bacterium]|nr:EF2563 family selenium-dependent molybdenum hydroxylase system protein [Bacillota bacterium]